MASNIIFRSSKKKNVTYKKEEKVVDLVEDTI